VGLINYGDVFPPASYHIPAKSIVTLVPKTTASLAPKEPAHRALIQELSPHYTPLATSFDQAQDRVDHRAPIDRLRISHLLTRGQQRLDDLPLLVRQIPDTHRSFHGDASIHWFRKPTIVLPSHEQMRNSTTGYTAISLLTPGTGRSHLKLAYLDRKVSSRSGNAS
jgi:hypothetical protein